MPWQEPGKGNKDPWKSNQDGPPDLGDAIKSFTDQINKLFGGGGSKSGSSGSAGSGGGLSIGFLVLAAVLVWGLMNSVHVLDASEQGVVLRFGKYNRTLDPGLQFTLPQPFEELTKVNVSEILSVEERGQMLTGDENLVDISFAVQYHIQEPMAYLFNVKDQRLTLLQASEAAMREVVGTNMMDFILEKGRAAVATDAKVLAQTILDRYDAGLEITQFNLQDVKPPSQVKAAFDDVVKAREDEQRYVNEAQAYRNTIIPEARGKAARISQEADAYRISEVAKAEGEAARFSLLLTEYSKAPVVTRQRLYLQTMEKVLGQNRKVLLDTGGNSMIYLPLDGIQGNSSRQIPPPVLPSNNQSQTQSAQSRESNRSGRGVR
ncbi:MAG: FtsH protease activity modulator HflK [Proteobacteria bacterium]|nr:FtsH protease activity modulator HflK [Pseudomonadota bacterium]